MTQRPWIRRGLLLGTLVSLAGVATWLAFLLTPPASVQVGSVHALLAARPGTGTAVQLAHGRPVADDVVAGPLALRVQLSMGGRPAPEPRLLSSLAGARGQLIAAVARYLAAVTLAAALLAALLAFLAFGRRRRRIIGTAALAACTVLSSAAATAATTRSGAFDSASCAHGWSRYVVADLPALTPPAPTVTAPPSPPSPDATALLLVADDHLNPEGLRFAHAVARAVSAQAVLDAGDTSSYGVSGEACVVTPLLRRFGLPYLWTRGNHDSPEFAAAMRAVRGVRVLDGTTSTVAGLTVYGLADPAYTPHQLNDPARLEAEVTAARPRVAADLERAPADVVLVHDCRMVPPAAAPLVLCGHTHRFAALKDGASLVLHTGTVGAGGLTAFGGRPVPFSALVLWFSPTSHQLLRYDEVTGYGGQPARWNAHDVPVAPSGRPGPAHS